MRVAGKIHADQRLRRAAAQLRHRRRPARCRTAPAPARPARRRRRARARPSAATAPWRARPRLRSAGSSMHSSSCIWMSAPSRHWISTARSGVSMWRLPSMCDWKRTPSSLISRILDSDMTWKPPRVGEDRPVPAHEGVQAAEAGDALGAGAQHQVIGVGEDDVGAGRLHLVEVERLDGGGGADRHEGRRADEPVRRRTSPRRAAPSCASSSKPKRRHAFLHRRSASLLSVDSVAHAPRRQLRHGHGMTVLTSRDCVHEIHVPASSRPDRVLAIARAPTRPG